MGTETLLELTDEGATDGSRRLGEEHQLLEEFRLIPDLLLLRIGSVFEWGLPGQPESIHGGGPFYRPCRVGLSIYLTKPTGDQLTVANALLDRGVPLTGVLRAPVSLEQPDRSMSPPFRLRFGRFYSAGSPLQPSSEIWENATKAAIWMGIGWQGRAAGRRLSRR